MSGTVIVVGGGPAGVLVTYLLARGGVPVTLLESRGDFDRRFRGDSLAPAVLDYLDTLGLADGLLAEVPHSRATAFRWHTPTRTYTLTDYRSASRRFGFYALIPQARFLPWLARRAEERSTVVRGEQLLSDLLEAAHHRRVVGRPVGTGLRDGELVTGLQQCPARLLLARVLLGGALSGARDGEVALEHLRAVVAGERVELVRGPVAARLRSTEVADVERGRKAAVRALSDRRNMALLDALEVGRIGFAALDLQLFSLGGGVAVFGAVERQLVIGRREEAGEIPARRVLRQELARQVRVLRPGTDQVAAQHVHEAVAHRGGRSVRRKCRLRERVRQDGGHVVHRRGGLSRTVIVFSAAASHAFV